MQPDYFQRERTMNTNNDTDAMPADETVADIPVTEATGADTETAAPEADAPAPVASEADQLKDRLLRLQADFDNFRKRSARERAEWQVFATENILQDLLPVLDHYELGLATAVKQQTAPAVLDGFRLVYDQLIGTLKRHGLAQVSVTVGEAFDPHRHDAISHLASEEHPADTVIAETRKGYTLGEKLIRPVQVVVSSGPGGS